MGALKLLLDIGRIDEAIDPVSSKPRTPILFTLICSTGNGLAARKNHCRAALAAMRKMSEIRTGAHRTLAVFMLSGENEREAREALAVFLEELAWPVGRRRTQEVGEDMDRPRKPGTLDRTGAVRGLAGVTAARARPGRRPMEAAKGDECWLPSNARRIWEGNWVRESLAMVSDLRQSALDPELLELARPRYSGRLRNDKVPPHPVLRRSFRPFGLEAREPAGRASCRPEWKPPAKSVSDETRSI